MTGEPKKIIVVFSAFFFPFEGGAERYVKEITERLSQNYRFIILTGRYKRSLPKKENRGSVEIIRLGQGLKLDKYLFIFLASFKAFFLKPDLVHSVLESYAGLALIIYKSLRPKMPALLTLQSGQVKMPKWLFKKIHQSADKIQAISQALAERALFFDCKDVIVVPNGLDKTIFQDTKSFLRQKHQIVSVAHLKKVKGLNYLIAAMPDILADFPDAKLILLGEGPEEKSLKLQTTNYKLQTAVIFKGKVSQEEVAKTLAESAIFVLPSLAEGMGIAVLEAQAAGAPVIASRVGGILDIVQDEVNGLLVEPKNPEQIAKAIARVLSEPSLAQKLAQNGRANAQKYDWSVIARRINQIYQDLI